MNRAVRGAPPPRHFSMLREFRLADFFTLGNAASDTSTLRIDSGAIYDVVADVGIIASASASIDNAGLFEKTGSNGSSMIAATARQSAARRHILRPPSTCVMGTSLKSCGQTGWQARPKDQAERLLPTGQAARSWQHPSAADRQR